jgi:hypothetical protein
MVSTNRRGFFVTLWCTLNSLHVSLNLKYRKFKDDLCFIFFGGNCGCVMFVLDGGWIKLQVKWRLGPNSIKLSTHTHTVYSWGYTVCTQREHTVCAMLCSRSLHHTFWSVLLYLCSVANCHKCCIQRKTLHNILVLALSTRRLEP